MKWCETRHTVCASIMQPFDTQQNEGIGGRTGLCLNGCERKTGFALKVYIILN